MQGDECKNIMKCEDFDGRSATKTEAVFQLY